MKPALGALALALLVAACSQQAKSTATSSPSPAPKATNPLTFPLYQDSAILTARPHEVIAETPATLEQLGAWIAQESANPPSGYEVAASGSTMDTAHAHAKAMGVEFQVFTHAVNGKTRVLIVAALDPVTFNEKAGPTLELIDKYPLLPESFRAPIDKQVQERTGFTVSQALDASQPIGAALAAAKELRNSGQRGLVLVDAAKE